MVVSIFFTKFASQIFILTTKAKNVMKDLRMYINGQFCQSSDGQ